MKTTRGVKKSAPSPQGLFHEVKQTLGGAGVVTGRRLF